MHNNIFQVIKASEWALNEPMVENFLILKHVISGEVACIDGVWVPLAWGNLTWKYIYGEPCIVKLEPIFQAFSIYSEEGQYDKESQIKGELSINPNPPFQVINGDPTKFFLFRFGEMVIHVVFTLFNEQCKVDYSQICSTILDNNGSLVVVMKKPILDQSDQDSVYPKDCEGYMLFTEFYAKKCGDFLDELSGEI